ncbi:MAG: HEAT repeat domain-containing protein [Armatimonadota bacterium]
MHNRALTPLFVALWLASALLSVSGWARPTFHPLYDDDPAALVQRLKDIRTEEDKAIEQALVEMGDRAITPLVVGLHDANPRTRIRSAEVLGKMDQQVAARAVPALIEALQDSELTVRKAAAIALGSVHAAQAVTPLINILTEGDSRQSSSAAEALAMIGQPAVEPLLSLLHHPKAGSLAALALRQFTDPRAVPALVGALQKGDRITREAAAEGLGAIHDPSGVEALAAALKDEELSVRMKAALALCRCSNTRVVLPLIQALATDVVEFRALLIRALAMTEDVRAVDPLLAALKDPDLAVRYAAALALQRFRDPRAITPLSAALHDDYAALRVQAALALGAIGDARAADPLFAALQDKDTSVQAAAVRGLAKLGDVRAVSPLTEMLNSKEALLQDAGAEGLLHLGEQGKDPLLATLAKGTLQQRLKVITILQQSREPWVISALIPLLEDEDPDIYIRVYQSLRVIGKPAVEPLLEAMKVGGLILRAHAITALCGIKDIPVEALVTAMTMADIRSRSQIIARFGQIGTPAIPALVNVLNTGEWVDQLSATSALGDTHDPSVIPTLFIPLAGFDLTQRTTAAMALKNIGDPAEQPLLDLLVKGDSYQRQGAALALGFFPNLRAADALLVAAKDADPAVRGQVMRSLGERRETRALPLLQAALRDTNKIVRSSAVYGLGMLRDIQATPALIELLRGKDTLLQDAAIGALARLRDPRAIEPLLEFSSVKDQYRRRQVIEALGVYNDPRAIAALCTALQDTYNETRLTAATALIYRQDKSAISPLIEALSDRDARVKAQAGRALTAITGQQFGNSALRWKAWWTEQQK